MNNNRKLKIKKMMKKGATISLCAVLAGGIGVGAYEGINYFSGAQSVQAATDSSEKLSLMKSDKKSNKDREDTEDTKTSDTKGSLDVSDVAEEAMPSVVAITTKSVQEEYKMKVVTAIDSFKGSMTSMEAGFAAFTFVLS